MHRAHLHGGKCPRPQQEPRLRPFVAYSGNAFRMSTLSLCAGADADAGGHLHGAGVPLGA